MKKLTLILLFIIAHTLSAMAVTPREVQPYEFGLRAGPNIPIGGYHSIKNVVSVDLGMDIRFNLEDMPYDIGLSFNLTGVRREEIVSPNENKLLWINNRIFGITLGSNYNFRQGYNINPYVGIGAGIGINSIVDTNVKNVSEFNSINGLFIPKAGIELFHHVRFELSYMLTRRGFNCLNFTVGFVIGGRPRK